MKSHRRLYIKLLINRLAPSMFITVDKQPENMIQPWAHVPWASFDQILYVPAGLFCGRAFQKRNMSLYAETILGAILLFGVSQFSGIQDSGKKLKSQSGAQKRAS